MLFTSSAVLPVTDTRACPGVLPLQLVGAVRIAPKDGSFFTPFSVFFAVFFAVFFHQTKAAYVVIDLAINVYN